MFNVYLFQWPSDAKVMATHIFIDKENGETSTAAASKDRLRLLSAPCEFVLKYT